MSEYNDTTAPAYPYGLSSQPCAATTTVAISLRQFEREAKAQAESEYDDTNGPMPEPPSADDTSIPPVVAQRMKRRRKVRSAIVSRRKSVIYLSKLERELDIKDSMNGQMETRLGVFRDVLRDTASRIDSLRQTIASDHAAVPSSPKRPRVADPYAHPQHPVIPMQNPMQNPMHNPLYPERPGFFLGDMDEIISISPEDMCMRGYMPPLRREEYSSPVTPREKGIDPGTGVPVPTMYLTDAVCKVEFP